MPKKITFTLEEMKQVFLNLEDGMVFPYAHIEEITNIPVNKLKKIVKELKDIGVVYSGAGWDPDTGLIAGKGISKYDDDQIKRMRRRGEITEHNWNKFLILMD